MPTVSVVIPAYNHSRHVLATLASVFAQTVSPCEVIVVNDGSPDDTGALVRPLAQAGRIRYFEQPNGGQAAARNRGIEEARGMFIALLDDDDLWPPDKLAWQIEALEQNPEAAVVYGQVQCVDESGTAFERRERTFWQEENGPTGDVYRALIGVNLIVSPGQTLIRRAALDALNEPPFDPAIWGADDWDLWLRLARRAPFLFSAKESLRYRYHSANASNDQVKMFLNTLRVSRKHRQRDENEPDLRDLWNQRIAVQRAQLRDEYVAASGGRAAAGDKHGALSHLWRAVWLDPPMIKQAWVQKTLLRHGGAALRQRGSLRRKS